MVRVSSIKNLPKLWKNTSEMFEFLYSRTVEDPFERNESFNEDNPRIAALKALLNNYPTHPKTLELLRDRAINDPDEQLREWAQQQLEMRE